MGDGMKDVQWVERVQVVEVTDSRAIEAINNNNSWRLIGVSETTLTYGWPWSQERMKDSGNVVVPLVDLLIILRYMEELTPHLRQDLMNALDRLVDITLKARMNEGRK